MTNQISKLKNFSIISMLLITSIVMSILPFYVTSAPLNNNQKNKDKTVVVKKFKQQPNKKYLPLHRDANRVIPKNRFRKYKNMIIVRPYGHFYLGYGRFVDDYNAFRWLAFSVISLKLLDNLNEQQQRAHEQSQIEATTADIGEKITWNDQNTGGFVMATKEGTSSSGKYCREFQQQIKIENQIEDAYGTACMQSDGSWEIISTN